MLLKKVGKALDIQIDELLLTEPAVVKQNLFFTIQSEKESQTNYRKPTPAELLSCAPALNIYFQDLVQDHVQADWS